MIDPKVLQELQDMLGEAASEALAEVIDGYLKRYKLLIQKVGILCRYF
jgi:proline dehydrogenase